MAQPAFSWWPFRILALAVPVIAAVSGAIAAENSNARDHEIFLIYFSVLGAGNGYVMSMAVGDFGRSVTAIPVGAASAWLAFSVLSYPLGHFAFLVIVFFMVVAMPMSTRHAGALGCLTIGLLGIEALIVMNTSSGRQARELALLNAFPFVCGCITGSMPLHRTFGGVISAVAVGVQAALFGTIVSILAFILSLILIAPMARATSGRGEIILFLLWILVCTLPANYFCIRQVFYSVYRAEVVPVPAAAQPEREALSEKQDVAPAPPLAATSSAPQAEPDSGPVSLPTRSVLPDQASGS